MPGGIVRSKMRTQWLTLVNTLISITYVACGGMLQDAKFAGGDGGSCASAVLIQGVSNERTGVQAERVWLDQHYPGHIKVSQSLIDCNGKKADRIAITTAEGEKKDIFFDISEFFGNY